MSYNGKNYAEQGGDKWVIGGTLEIKEGASVTGLPAAEVPQAANQADSVATDVPTLVSDFNGLLAKLKAAGLSRYLRWLRHNGGGGPQHGPPLHLF